MTVRLHHLHTYFLFPFSISKEIASQEHAAEWRDKQFWIHGLDACVKAHANAGAPVVQHLGPWTRAAYTRSDMDSPAYADMVFFHSYVRRIFFDTGDDPQAVGVREPLIRCFLIPRGVGHKLWFTAEDRRGRSARVEIADLRLFLFANGTGILSIGVEAFDLTAKDALWINETMRKIYPSSGRQIREGRGPSRYTLVLESDGREQVVLEERRSTIDLVTALRTEVLHFANYWYFEELANKDEEVEHFILQCRSYGVGEMKLEIEREVEKLNAAVHEYYQTRATDAVNRLAMLSMMLGAGAVATGYFGMNFGREFGLTFFEGHPSMMWVYYAALAFVTVMAVGALVFGLYIVLSNPSDYRDILTPRRIRAKRARHWYNLKKGLH